MDGIIYLTLEQAKAIHAKTIEYSGGGTYEHFDLGRLDSVLQNIQNDDYYPTFEDKLTHLFFCVCEFHCFADGNKRLAITLSAQFLLFNGYMAVAKSFFSIMENISYQVAAGKINKELLHRIVTAVMDGTYEIDEELKLDIIHAIEQVEDKLTLKESKIERIGGKRQGPPDNLQTKLTKQTQQRP